MFRQILYTQLKWTRGALATFAVLAFVMPAALWRMTHSDWFRTFNAIEVMRGFETLGPSLGVLAFFCGFMGVAQPWAVDASARHVYPLALPLPWSRYVGMRFGAGALLLLVPTLTLWFGALLVLSLVEIPASLHAYPGTLALRFLLGALLSYALVFAVQYVSGRKAAHLLLGLLLFSVSVVLLAEFTQNQRVVTTLFGYLIHWPGPLAVFAEPWMLVDV